MKPPVRSIPKLKGKFSVLLPIWYVIHPGMQLDMLINEAKDRSSLSIAHRLSTIINSDQIVVMKDGQVVEHGAYKELLDMNGAFAAM
jgi:ABC-type proline/glycine betaine transport system ATPase subunit